MKWKLKLATIIFLTLAIFVSGAWAAPSFYVTTNGMGDGSTWALASKDLAGILKNIPAASTDVEIWVASGDYVSFKGASADSFNLKAGVKLYGGFAGDETILESRDWRENPTILSGDNKSYHVVMCSADNTTSTDIKPDNTRLDGFIITGGKANGGSANNNGGGMYNGYSSPAIANCTFVGNTATSGGGMYNLNASPVITNCTFSGNTATDSGGGMYNITNSSPVITNCTFAENKSTSSIFGGGGMYNTNASSSPVVVNTIFWGNTATNGPAIYHSSLSGTLTLSNDVITPDGVYRQTGTTNLIHSSDIITATPKIVSVDVTGGAPAISADVYIYKVESGSSAIGKGLAVGTAVSGGVTVPTHDQSGDVRPTTGGVTIGSYEYAGAEDEIEIAVDPTELTLEAGKTSTITATVTGTSDTAVTWSSDDDDIATVSTSGLVTAVAAGTATIKATASADATISADCVVTVTATPVPVTITVNPTTLNLTVGGATGTLTATVYGTTNQAVTWTTSDATKATVSNGVVTAVAAGTATITVTASADTTKTATCDVTVTATPVSVTITVNPTTLNLTVGGATGTLTATVSGTTDTAVTWTTSDATKATVSNGVVTAVAAGNATITATASADTTKSATCVVTVTGGGNVKVTGITLNHTKLSLVGAQSAKLTANVLPTDAANKNVTWKSSNEAVAEVSSFGVVKGKDKVGTATITATTVDGGFSATCAVEVNIEVIEPVKPIIIGAPGDVKPAQPKEENDTKDAADKMKNSDLETTDLEVVNGAVRIKADIVQDIGKDKKASFDTTYELPVFTATVPHGEVVAVGYQVKGKELLAEKPESVQVLKVFLTDSGDMFVYENDPKNFGDKKFTVQNKDDTITARGTKIDTGKEYKLILFIRDGGDFDLDGEINGQVVDPTSILGTVAGDTPPTPDPKHGGRGGCGGDSLFGLNIGFSMFALALVPLLMKGKKKK